MTRPRSSPLRTYRALARWLPFHHLDEKLTGLFFCALLVPLLALIGCVLLAGELSARAAVMPVMVATLAGAGAALWALQALLAPLRLAQDALHRPGSEPLPLPTDLTDDMGQMLRDLRRRLESGAARERDAQARHLDDALTGLPSERLSAEYLRLCMQAAERAGCRLSIALIDPDPAHRLAAHGNAAGDQLVAQLGSFLKQWLNRRSDWVGRWSGDQFLAVLFGDQNQATAYLDNLRREFSRQRLGLTGSSLSVNLAITELRPHESSSELIARLEGELRDARCGELELPAAPTSDKVHSLAEALRKQRGR